MNLVLQIGEQSAERIKIEAGSAMRQVTGRDVEIHIKGRDLVAGVPRTLSITSDEIRDAISEPVNGIADDKVRAYCRRQRELLQQAFEAARPRWAFHGHWHLFHTATLTCKGPDGRPAYEDAKDNSGVAQGSKVTPPALLADELPPPSVLVAMNAAALKADLHRLEPHGLLIVNSDSFEERDLEKAGYTSNPLEDGSLEGYRLVQIPMTSLTQGAAEPLGVKPRDAERSKNFFALGLICWMYTHMDMVIMI